jgi:hypothetical protein
MPVQYSEKREDHEMTPEDQSGDFPDSEEGYDQSETQKADEPVTGETTERQPAWRPGSRPTGQGIYKGEHVSSTGTGDEPEGRGI